jgi:hypothetical protein
MIEGQLAMQIFFNARWKESSLLTADSRLKEPRPRGNSKKDGLIHRNWAA